MNGKTIAIIEDDKDILELIALHVQKAGFKPKKFTDGESFFRYLSTDMPDVLILDLMLPDMDGLEICKVLRSNPSTAKLPIIILTAKIEETDKIVGLELGADDYITKPFSPRELIARVKAVLRRTSEEETTEEEILKVGDKIVIDVNKMEVYVEGKKVDLTLTEFKILKHLAKKPGWVFSREQLLDAIWGVKKSVIDRTVDVHIKKLRDKLGKAGKGRDLVKLLSFAVDNLRLI